MIKKMIVTFILVSFFLHLSVGVSMADVIDMVTIFRESYLKKPFYAALFGGLVGGGMMLLVPDRPPEYIFIGIGIGIISGAITGVVVINTRYPLMEIDKGNFYAHIPSIRTDTIPLYTMPNGGGRDFRMENTMVSMEIISIKF